MAAVPFLFPLNHTPRGQVFDALFAYLKQIPPPTGGSWKTFSQSLAQWDNYPAANQPAMFLHRGPQTATQNKAFGVTKWQWKVQLWMYYRTDGLNTTNTYPDQLTDVLLDAVERLFQTDPNVGRLTLGGLVHHCWIDGIIAFESGIADAQAVAVVPISILL